MFCTAVSTYQRVEEIILQSHGRPRSSGSESCGSTNDRTVKAAEHTDRPISGLADKQVNGVNRQNGFPAMTSTPGEFSAMTSIPSAFRAMTSIPG